VLRRNVVRRTVVSMAPARIASISRGIGALPDITLQLPQRDLQIGAKILPRYDRDVEAVRRVQPRRAGGAAGSQVCDESGPRFEPASTGVVPAANNYFQNAPRGVRFGDIFTIEPADRFWPEAGSPSNGQFRPHAAVSERPLSSISIPRLCGLRELRP